MADRVAPDDWALSVWSHAAVMDMQARLDPARMARLADDWQLAVDRICDILVGLNGQVATQLDRSWRGRGADAATDALRRYIAGSLTGLCACRSAAVHLGELSTAAEDLRAAISPQDLDAALAQVRQLYSAPAVAAGNAVDDIPPPPDPFQLAGRAPANTLPSAVPQTADPAQAVQPATAPGNPALSPAFAEESPRDDVPATGLPDSRWRAPTHSAELPPVDSPSPARPEPPGATTLPPAASAPPNTPAPPGVATRATQSAAMPYLGGMYPGHLGRGSGGEHQAPRYLISAGNSNELIGELPLVAPPVIGE